MPEPDPYAGIGNERRYMIMKKYVKPEIYYENFELSQHIADCGWELQEANENICHATGDTDWGYPSDVFAFITGAHSCDIQPEGYCYTNGSSAVGLYKS